MADDIKLGEFITGRADRDAVHIAVFPLEAGQQLRRGQRIALAYGTQSIAHSEEYAQRPAIGIVDPFLEEEVVEGGKKFWCFLFPNTVTGMRHHWQHPAFTFIEKSDNEHERWIREFASQWNFDYDQLIEAAIGTGEWRYVVANGMNLHGADELGEDHNLFWSHLEAMTGEIYSQSHREGVTWSCSC